MPGWHDATSKLRQEGKLQMIGIVQEQHPERSRLFMQWKEMDWPLMVDALNLLEVPYVPVTIAIDEHGIMRKVGMRANAAATIEETFLSKTFETPEPAVEAGANVPDISKLKVEAVRSGTAEAWRRYAEQLFLWGGVKRLDEAVEGLERALAVDPDDGWAKFRLGVALRTRYDAGAGPVEDFGGAVGQWTGALAIDPNNYIWRRRIQQYGPRLDKPYSFYDWVHQARDEIRARGEEPLMLAVEPRGAEFAHPMLEFEPAAAAAKEPDAEGKVHRDKGRFVQVETTVVPPTVRPGGSARVHVVFRPNTANKSHWNNEAGDLEVWLSPSDGLGVDHRRLSVARPKERVSLEARSVEFEVKLGSDAEAGTHTLPAYALYYVCEDVKGACLYRRQDLPVTLRVRPSRAGAPPRPPG